MPGMNRYVLDRDFVVADVPRRLFGSFVEHLGRCVYTGIYEPGHALADGQGFRRDVLQLIRELGVTMVRYPGGNFVSGYNWEDGVGPVEKRPVRRDLAWNSLESNRFGTNEFIAWCRAAGVEPMMAINLGTRGPKEAGEFFEYCNHPGGTAWSDLRRGHGSEQPHDIKLWCLGNEMDGPWQMGACSPEEYGKRAREAAKLLISPDPSTSLTQQSIECIACGSSGRGMPTYGHWDQTVLENCFEQVHYLSVHSYANPLTTDLNSFLAFNDTHMGPLIQETTAIADAVAAKKKSDKRINLSYDEWNVWSFKPAPEGVKPWDYAPPLLQDVYDMKDALCVGGMLITLINHCDRVRIAALAQLVNVIAPIMTRAGGPAWRQTIFHPFAQASRYSHGLALRQVIKEQASISAGMKAVPAVVFSAIAHDDSSEGTKQEAAVTLLGVNRSAETQRLSLTLRGFPNLRVLNHWVMRHDDLAATNTEDEPEKVKPMGGQTGSVNVVHEQIDVQLDPYCWFVVRLG